jgi:hypothetical protein
MRIVLELISLRPEEFLPSAMTPLSLILIAAHRIVRIRGRMQATRRCLTLRCFALCYEHDQLRKAGSASLAKRSICS